MLRVLVQVLLADLRARPLPAISTIIGIACGLALVVAVEGAGSAAKDRFGRVHEQLSGRATHQLTAQERLTPDDFARVMSRPEVQAATPLITGLLPLTLAGRGGTFEDIVQVLGVDPFTIGDFLPTVQLTSPGGGTGSFTRFLVEPRTVVLPEAWARAQGLDVGDSMQLIASSRPVELEVVHLLPSSPVDAERPLALVDLATADELLGRGGRLDRIDLQLHEDADAESFALPGQIIERPRSRGERGAKLFAAFRINLLALSSLALLVGAGLAWGASQFNVIRRAPLLSRLRCLGTSRRALLQAVLSELALMGLVGSVIGVILGWLLAQVLVDHFAGTIRMLYGELRVSSVPFRPGTALLQVLGGMSVTLLSGALPAWEAATTPPRLVGLRSRAERLLARRVPILVVLSTVFVLLGLVAWAWPSRRIEPVFAAAGCFLAAAATLLPALMHVALPALRRQLERRGFFLPALATGTMSQGLSRTGPAAATLSAALAMALALLVMLASFKTEVMNWLDSVLQADVFVASAVEDRVPEEVIAIARSLPGLEDVEILRSHDAVFRDRLVVVFGVDGREVTTARSRSLEQGNWDEAWAGFLAGEVILSQPFATRFELGLGDELTLHESHPPQRVVGVVQDYALDRGYALMSAAAYLERFGDTGIDNLALTFTERAPGHSQEMATVLRQSLAKAPNGPFLLQVEDRATLREGARAAFDQTFVITKALELIAAGLALVGIANTLIALGLERRHELAVLRAIGSSSRQLLGLFCLEGLLLSTLAALAAIPLGLVLAALMIEEVHPRSFGWTFPWSWPIVSVVALLLAALAAGAIAAIVPGLRFGKTSLAAAFEEQS
ncbi:MAG: FtsX-like permease family protein [Acidobacteriota bacterium]